MWLSLDASGDDAAVLLADLATALHRISPLDDALLRRLTVTGSRQPAQRVRLLTRHMEQVDRPVLVVLDDLQFLSSHGALDTVSGLIDRLPRGWTLAFASRTMPDLHLARLRASGRLLELTEHDLAMDGEETRRVVTSADLDLPEATIELISHRTEGWPVAIYLAVLSIQQRRDPDETASELGQDRLIADYVRDELLRDVPARHRRFMTRTSILDELSPDLCDHVVGTGGSAALLTALERSNAFVVPLVGRPGSHRYHHLFREVLREELRRREPDLVPELYRRAMTWCEAQGRPDEAIGYANEGGHAGDAARLVCTVVRRYASLGRFETLGRWLGWFDEDAVRAYPPLGVAAGWYHAFLGDEEPIRWLRLAEAGTFDGPTPDGSSSFEASVALLRAALCLNGPERMREDVRIAAALGSPTSEWRVVHHLLAGEAALLLGETERARTVFIEGVELAGPAQPGGHVMLLSELAAIAADEGAWDEAERYVGRARSLAAEYGLGDVIVQPLTYAVSALVAIHHGDVDAARAALLGAQRLRATSSFAIPSFSIRGRLAMARAYLALSDVDAARTVLREARDFQARRPNIGTLATALNEAEEEVLRARGRGASGPTT
jgi:LuxR family maltose regulon positive regulatory protein